MPDETRESQQPSPSGPHPRPHQGSRAEATSGEARHQAADQTSQGNQERQVQQGQGPAQDQSRRPRRRRRQRHRPGPAESQQPGGTGRLDISVVIPLLNEEQSLKELHQQLRATLHRMNARYELLFIDDGSTDRSFQVLRDLKRGDHRIKIIRFRRNYGKSAALSVGFQKAEGSTVITLDADLQDDPSEIPALVRKLNDGYDLVSGWKRVRRDPITKTIPSRFFNFVTSLMTGIRIHDFNCGLKAYRSEVVKTVNVYGELHRYVPVLAHWEGFRVGELPVQHRARKYGKSKFGIGRFWRGFLDLVTVLFTTRYFRRPLHLFGFWGACAVLAGLVIDGWLAVEWFLGTTSLSNRPLFLGGILLIIVGIQIVSIGLLGEMITKAKRTEEEYAIRDFLK